MHNKQSIQPPFLLSVANVEEMVARERSVMVPRTERVREEDEHTDDFLCYGGGESELFGGGTAEGRAFPDDDSGRATPDSQRSDTYPAGVGRAASMQKDLDSVPPPPPEPALAEVLPQPPVPAVDPLPAVPTAVPVPPLQRVEERRQASAAEPSAAELGAVLGSAILIPAPALTTQTSRQQHQPTINVNINGGRVNNTSFNHGSNVTASNGA
eukprot:715440-Rhodomonas_salina.1